MNIYKIPTTTPLPGATVEEEYRDIVRTTRAATKIPLAVLDSIQNGGRGADFCVITGSFTIADGVFSGSFTTSAGTYSFNCFQSTLVNRMANISTRGLVGTGQGQLIGGFIITGGPKMVLIRAMGPSMTAAGVSPVLANPSLQLFAQQTPLAQNDDWRTNANAADIIASGVAPSWAPKLMKKVKLTPPLCPACEATMDEISGSSGSVWVCSQRPECRGRRSARKQYKPMPAAAAKPVAKAEPQTVPRREQPRQPAVSGRRGRTFCPSTAPGL